MIHKQKIPSSKLRSAAFKRVRNDHAAELAEDYVEMIAELIDAVGEARCTDLAMRLGVANATVVKTLRRLQQANLVTQEPYRPIFLTEEGWALAEAGKRRHALVEKFLRALGVSAKTASIDSEGIEHHVSSETLRAMAKFLARFNT